MTITASADASSLASCTTYSGSVAIPSDLTIPQDSNGHQSLSVEGVQKITGNLTVTNAASLSSLSFGDLESIGGFELGGLIILSELSFPKLTQVSELNFTALPALQQLSFGGTGVTKADSILVSNTQLSSLQGLNNLQQVTSFRINNNDALQNISLQVKQIKGALNVEANDAYPDGVTVSFPMMQTAENMTFRNCSSVSLPSLANVTDNLGFYGNTMQSFAAPNLTTTGGLIFVDNVDLTNVSLPVLTSVNGSYTIANNTLLKRIDGFQKLNSIGGALDFNGNFTTYVNNQTVAKIYHADYLNSVELPALKQVKGGFNMQSSGDLDCSGFKALGKQVIKGTFVCQGGESKPGGAGTKPSSSSKASSSSSSAAGRMDVSLSAALGSTSIFAGLLQLIL